MNKIEESDIGQWRSAMSAQPLDRLRALAENYLGGACRSADKVEIVDKLASMMAKPDTQRAAQAMIDDTDALILGCVIASRGISKAALKRLLESSLSYFDLEYRLANLKERLLVYERQNGHIAAVPFFEAALRPRFANAGFLFGASPRRGAAKEAASRDALPRGKTSLLDLSLILYSFLRHGKKPLLKSGLLSTHSKERLQKLTGADNETMAIMETILLAFVAAGVLRQSEQGFGFDHAAFKHLFADYGTEYPYALVTILSGAFTPQNVRELGRRIAPYFEADFRFSAVGLSRFSGMLLSARDDGTPWPDYLPAMKQLGLIGPDGDEWVCRRERAVARRPLSTAAAREGKEAVMEGTGIIHVLPSASAGDLLAMLDVGCVISVADSWDIEITRETAKLAFAEGQTTQSILGMLARICGTEPPQTLRYNVTAWEEEYNALVFYRGSVLAVDAATAKILEQSGALAGLSYRKIRDGVYYLGSLQHSSMEQILDRLGLPSPSLVLSAKGGRRKDTVTAPAAPLSSAAPSPARTAARAETSVEAPAGVKATVPSAAADSVSLLPCRSATDAMMDRPPELELLASVRAMDLPESVARLLEERIERKLIYTREQLVALAGLLVEKMGGARNLTGNSNSPQRGVRKLGPGALSAGGLDFQGKLHIIQSALKSKFCKLDIRWTSGGKRKSSSVRPVSLVRTADDWMLSGEDTASGQAVTIRVGSISQIRQEKGFLLGDE